MKNVLLVDGPRAGVIEQVPDGAVGLRDEATKTWYRPSGSKPIQVEVWGDTDQLI